MWRKTVAQVNFCYAPVVRAPDMLDADNRLFALAREGQRQPSMLVAITVTIVTLAVTIVGGQMLARIIFHTIPLAGTESSTDPFVEGIRRLIDDAVGFLPVYLCLWGWLAFWSKRSFRTLGFERQRPAAHALGGGLVGLLMMSIVAIGIAMLPRTALARGTLQTAGLVAIGGSLLMLAGTAIQSSAEEALFRGWLLPSIGLRAGPWIGVTVSSLLFGLAHGLNPHVTALGVINLTLFGGFLALYALREGGLWGACAWHTAWNWTESDLFGLSGSGGPLHGALLTSVKPGGPDVATGGAFGPDGGLIQLAVLLIGVAVLVSLVTDVKNNSGNGLKTVGRSKRQPSRRWISTGDGTSPPCTMREVKGHQCTLRPLRACQRIRSRSASTCCVWWYAASSCAHSS